jgi:hypothetical protein
VFLPKGGKKYKKIFQGSEVEVAYSDEDEHLNKTKGGTLDKKPHKPRLHRVKNDSVHQAGNAKLGFKNSSTKASDEMLKGQKKRSFKGRVYEYCNIMD